MPVDHHFQPAIARQLTQHLQNRNWNGLWNYLQGLSNSSFRTACNILSEETLCDIDGPLFWECFSALVPQHPKALLVTFLKPAVHNYRGGRLNLQNPFLEEFARQVADEERAIDEKKFLQAFLPIIHSADDVWELFNLFRIESIHRRVAYLIPCDNIYTYFVLFQCFRRMDHAPALLSNYCNQLVRKGSNRAFNLVSIMKCYFDLPLVKGNFSLRLEKYELSRLDASLEDFRTILCRI